MILAHTAYCYNAFGELVAWRDVPFPKNKTRHDGKSRRGDSRFLRNSRRVFKFFSSMDVAGYWSI